MSMKSQLLESFDYESHYLFFFFSKVQTNFRGEKEKKSKNKSFQRLKRED